MDTPGEREKHPCVVSLEGEIDRAEMQAARVAARPCLDSGAKGIILDLGEVFYVSEEAVASLLDLRRDAQERKAHVLLTNLTPFVRYKFLRMGLMLLFSEYPHVQAAFEALRDLPLPFVLLGLMGFVSALRG